MDNFLLVYVIGFLILFLYCNKIVFILIFEVLVCNIKVLFKFGIFKINVIVSDDLRVMKVFFCGFFYIILLGCFFLVRLVNGFVIVEKFGMNFL